MFVIFVMLRELKVHKITMKISLWLVGLTCSASIAYGQNEPWTLENCIQYAFDHNLQVRQSEMNLESSELDVQSSNANFLPDLNLSGGYFWNFGLSVDPVSNIISRADRQTGNLALTSTWVIFDGLQNYRTYQKSRLDRLAATYRLDGVKNDIAVNIASNYLTVLLNKEALKVAQQQYNTSSLMFERTKKLYDAGSQPYAELLSSESQMYTDEQNLVNAQNQVDISLLALSQLLQLEDAVGFDIVEPEYDLPENAAVLASTPQQIYTEASALQPSIKAAEMDVQSAEKAVSLASGNYYPRLSLQGQISTSYSDQDRAIQPYPTTNQVGYWTDPTTGNITYVFNDGFGFSYGDTKPFGDQFNDNIREFVGLNLTVPIFNRLDTRNQLRKSKLTLAGSQLTLETRKNELRQTIQRAHADATASLKSYHAATKAVESSEENLKYAQIRREQGAISQYDYATAQNNFISAKAQQIRSKYDYIFKLKVLEFYLTNRFNLD